MRWTNEQILEALREDAARLGRSPSHDGDWYYTAPHHPSAVTVARRFGSWKTALEAAGLSPNAPGTRPYWTKDRVGDAILDWRCREGRWPELKDWEHADPEGRWPSGHHVRRMFGGWLRAHRHAGRALTPGQKSRAHIMKKKTA